LSEKVVNTDGPKLTSGDYSTNNDDIPRQIWA